MCKLFKKKGSLSVPLEKIKNELKKKNKHPFKPTVLSQTEKTFLQKIEARTNRLNVNNVTRTNAYLDFYIRHPEIHWAFLGHMVSRNGGWNMTDLKGGLLSRLLTKQETNSFFTFLERGNWLIFQDAYPQFLVYEVGIKYGKNLTYLLPHLGVSTFMETIWNQFFINHDTYILTMALVINEQSYLEYRILDNPTFKKEVFGTLEFKLQDFLSMNHILFPCLENGEITLAGETLHHFESLHKRIMLGKRLYAILFGNHHRLKTAGDWAKSTPHTGSRKDYWPHLFNDINEQHPGSQLKPKLKSCQIVSGVPRIFSPRLEFAWKNQSHLPAEEGDWYKPDSRVFDYLIDTKEKIKGDIENEYCKSLERIELAAITKKAISILV